MIVGLISDTHGLLRPEALKALRGSDHILHAGDIGSPDIIPALRQIAPVKAIRGNVDVQAWAQEFPETDVVELAGRLFYMIHDLSLIDLNPKAAGFRAVISGHSHKPGQEIRDGVLFVNPGSAGPKRFKLPISVGRVRVESLVLEAEILEL